MANKLALVTGASSGIGLSLAQELGRRGYDLVVCSAGERLQTTARQLRGTSVDVLEVQADLATAKRRGKTLEAGTVLRTHGGRGLHQCRRGRGRFV